MNEKERRVIGHTLLSCKESIKIDKITYSTMIVDTSRLPCIYMYTYM